MDLKVTNQPGAVDDDDDDGGGGDGDGVGVHHVGL